MIETNAPLAIDTGKQSHANWAVQRRRRGAWASRAIASVIIRARPLALVHLALLLCAASGAGMFVLATRALGVSV